MFRVAIISQEQEAEDRCRRQEQEAGKAGKS
jgi:hypothetical protein